MFATNPVISVVVPVFNTEQYLSRCIKSIVRQSFRDIEIILVNDGSSDTSGEICDEWVERDDRVRVVHKNNEGVTAARKLGVSLATGKWIKFVDSDDYLPEDALAKLFSHVKDDVDIVGGVYEFMGDRSINYECFGEKSSLEYLKLLLRHKTDWGPYCRIIRKALFDDFVFDIPRKVTVGEDLLMNLRVGQKAKRILLVPEVVYFYVWRPTSAMAQVHMLTREYMRAFNRAFSRSFLNSYRKVLRWDLFYFRIRRSFRFLRRRIVFYIKME